MAKSEYLQREEAAKKQLGAKGVKKRVKQLPTAARASLREMTGIDVSRKGVSVDPMGVAMALPLGKVAKAAVTLRNVGRAAEAAALGSRMAAKAAGQGAGKSGIIQAIGKQARKNSERVFKRSSGAQSREFLGMNSQEITANLARKTGRASGLGIEDIRAFSKATANSTTGFTNFSKKLPKTGRGVGTVNQKGLEKMIAGGREPSREMLRIPQILKGTNEAYESIAQKAIKAAGLRKTPKKRGGR
jgi:hypothetical protein